MSISAVLELDSRIDEVRSLVGGEPGATVDTSLPLVDGVQGAVLADVIVETVLDVGSTRLNKIYQSKTVN